MKLMDYLHWERVDAENLNFFKAIGVDSLLVLLPEEMADGTDHTDEFKQLWGLVEDHGLELFGLHCARIPRDRIVHGLPGKDEQIEDWIRIIRAIGGAGVPATATTFYAISHFRTSPTYGRGGPRYSTFDIEEHRKAPPHFAEKVITEERLWENIEYFIQRVVPVAAEAGVRIALHPDDPPISEPLGGAARIVVSLENYQRIFDLVPSEANAMLFCQGCVAEMGEDVSKAIRTIGGQNKIVFVHFRNIRLRRAPYGFQEMFVDEGDVDMVRAMETYREAGFQGPFMMDHTPNIPGDSEIRAGRAYANGYIKALLQAVYR